jgi:MFS family permease
MPVERTADGGNRLAITVCVILATLMQALDTTIANVALPYMQGSVSATQDQIDWVLTSYIVAAAIMTPPTGFLVSRFGLKRLFLVSVAGFHRRLDAVRHVAVANADRAVPHSAGRIWRGACSALAIRAAQH